MPSSTKDRLTFRAFADYWGFEPRLCRPYRAQTKGKVESGVKYFKGNFLPGRAFVDDVDLHEQLVEWMATIADVRIHGTTHERPVDRFVQEQAALGPTTSQPSFRLEAPLARIVADDWLVSLDTNRYSVTVRSTAPAFFVGGWALGQLWLFPGGRALHRGASCRLDVPNVLRGRAPGAPDQGTLTVAFTASEHFHQPAKNLIVERLDVRHRHLDAAEQIPVSPEVRPDARGERHGVPAGAVPVERLRQVGGQVEHEIAERRSAPRSPGTTTCGGRSCSCT